MMGTAAAALLLMLSLSASVSFGAGQETHNMTFMGHERQYYVSLPPNPSAATGLIVALTPDSIFGAMWFCRKELGGVARQTGAIVICPAALSFNSSGPGHPGTLTPCWLSFAHNGYCMGGKPESSMDVEFLAALIGVAKSRWPAIPHGRTIMSGISNGGSCAYRFYCEQSELIDGLVIGIQAWFDPYVGYFDYIHHRLPSGQPQCAPKKQVPLYSADGTKDWFYGQPPCFPGFESVANWRNFSEDILGCTGQATATPRGPHDFPQGPNTTCYAYPSCPHISGAQRGLNIMCEVGPVRPASLPR
jgi:poly(3-hydroxybutyrate) depolymerase